MDEITIDGVVLKDWLGRGCGDGKQEREGLERHYLYRVPNVKLKPRPNTKSGKVRTIYKGGAMDENFKKCNSRVEMTLAALWSDQWLTTPMIAKTINNYTGENRTSSNLAASIRGMMNSSVSALVRKKETGKRSNMQYQLSPLVIKNLMFDDLLAIYRRHKPLGYFIEVVPDLAEEMGKIERENDEAMASINRVKGSTRKKALTNESLPVGKIFPSPDSGKVVGRTATLMLKESKIGIMVLSNGARITLSNGMEITIEI